MTPCKERDFMARRGTLPWESPEHGQGILTWPIGEEKSRTTRQFTPVNPLTSGVQLPSRQYKGQSLI
jgi:hypothetical protein